MFVATAQLCSSEVTAPFLLRSPLSLAVVAGAVRPQEVRMLRLSQLWSFLSFLWTGTGSILEPDGESKPTSDGSGDTGSILDPNGRP